jgi:uncharacterized membrane protein
MNLSYQISEKLDSYLKKIDELRRDILLYPLSPKIEVRLKWDCQLERIIWALALNDILVSKPDVVKLLAAYTDFPKKKLKESETSVINLRKAFAYIKENWTVSKNLVTMKTVDKLYEVSCRKSIGPMTGLTEYSEKRMGTFLDYLQKGREHPIIQAGIAQVETINITPFDKGNGRVARLFSYLFLYKNGYDIRDMLVLEEYYKHDVVTYKRVLELSKIQGNMTLWLEYFAFGVMVQLAKAKENIVNLKFQEELPKSFWKLNARQKEILDYLERPELKITNKEVQKSYAVSQITASRDLSKLANLGFLFAHGKGRSVFYTRV